jgi:hypothetical protein
LKIIIKIPNINKILSNHRSIGVCSCGIGLIHGSYEALSVLSIGKDSWEIWEICPGEFGTHMVVVDPSLFDFYHG